MATRKTVQSVEPDIADLANDWLKSYKLDYKLEQGSLNKENEKLKERREREINASLVKLNNDIYQNEKGLGENDRVYLVAASIIATLGDAEKNVYPLKKSDLKSSMQKGNTDGDIMVHQIEAFLDTKNLPTDKKELITLIMMYFSKKRLI